MKLEYQIIKKKNSYCNNKRAFESFVNSDDNFKVDSKANKITYKDIAIDYDVKIESNEYSETIIIFSLSYDPKKETLDAIKVFENFDNAIFHHIHNNMMSGNVTINTLIDDISKEYACRLYPKINNIEKTLRKIIYIFMEKSLGREWVKKAFPIDIKTKLDETLKRRNITENNNDYLEEIDFIVLSSFLFDKYSTGNFDNILKELKKLDNDLSIDKIEKIINENEKKSNYERFFKDDLRDDKFDEKWKTLYQYRNLVAHNKKIRKKDYENATTLINQFESMFQECLNKLNKDVKMTKEQKNELQELGNNVLIKNMDSNLLNFKLKFNNFYGIQEENSTLSYIKEIIEKNQTLAQKYKINLDKNLNFYLDENGSLKIS